MFKRRITQLTSLIILHSSWGPELKWLCNPVLSCHSCVLAWFACPVGVFVHYSSYHIFPFIAVGTVLLIGALAGRLFCGWVCPFGFLMDMLYKIPSPKFDMPKWSGWFKYAVLGLTVIGLPFFLGESNAIAFGARSVILYVSRLARRYHRPSDAAVFLGGRNLRPMLGKPILFPMLRRASRGRRPLDPLRRVPGCTAGPPWRACSPGAILPPIQFLLDS